MSGADANSRLNTIESLSSSIFRAYDIRGVVGETLSTDVLYLIGLALGSEVLEQGDTKIAVGRDGRLSGPSLVKALIEGLLDSGIDVVDIGRVPTPVLYYATNVLDTTSGVMLTGSHNPVDHNGTKIVIKGRAIYGDEILNLYHRIKQKKFSAEYGKKQGHLERQDLLPEYSERIVQDVKLAKPLKVVVDCGNGVAGVIAPKLLKQMGCEVSELFCEVDGKFPNHHPDPSQEDNLQDLIQMVHKKNADIGLAFDGDGDRLGVVTANGEVIWPDRQLILYAKNVLENNPGAKIIYDVKSTKHLDAMIKQYGGEALMYKTGHSLVKAKIKETGAKLGGEMSGHVFFNDRWYGFDDALYTAARLLELVAQDGRSLDEIFQEVPDSVSTPELKISMADDQKFDFISEMVNKADFGAEAKLNTMDGLRVDFDYGWGLVRASNTTPYLVVRFEADDEAGLKKVQSMFRQLLLSLDAELNLPF